MDCEKKGSITIGMIWMFVISLLLFWLPAIGPLIAGIVGGKVAGGVGSGLLAAILPGLLRKTEVGQRKVRLLGITTSNFDIQQPTKQINLFTNYT